MNRLTHERVNGIKTGYWSPGKKQDLVDRLAEYEDTGLTPEQVRELVEKQKPMKVEKLKSAQYPYRCPACGYLLEIGYKHCISCGQRLEYEKEEVK